jgi:phospholipase C
MKLRWLVAVGIVGATFAAVVTTSCADQSAPGAHGDADETPDASDDVVEGSDAPEDAPADAPLTTPTPIDHVVVLVKENRTFDNLFGLFPGADGATTATLSTGEVITRPRAPAGALPRDVAHAHGDALTAYRGGR